MSYMSRYLHDIYAIFICYQNFPTCHFLSCIQCITFFLFKTFAMFSWTFRLIVCVLGIVYFSGIKIFLFSSFLVAWRYVKPHDSCVNVVCMLVNVTTNAWICTNDWNQTHCMFVQQHQFACWHRFVSFLNYSIGFAALIIVIIQSNHI